MTPKIIVTKPRAEFLNMNSRYSLLRPVIRAILVQYHQLTGFRSGCMPTATCSPLPHLFLAGFYNPPRRITVVSS